MCEYPDVSRSLMPDVRAISDEPRCFGLVLSNYFVTVFYFGLRDYFGMPTICKILDVDATIK